MMKQYAIVHKPNMTPISFYCTEKAAMKRLMFLTDCNVFGLFEVDVNIVKVLENPTTAAEYNLGTVCTINNCLLAVHPHQKTAYQHEAAIKTGLFKICDVEYVYCKEIKRPKKENENVLNDFS